ncbi:scoloptoxin SSD43-like [Teleopsis dalmanni]|uniref:scoloptoxin SSD43-like n=1 Tax=Teleopsis dalmanni TaxID=139649 RepID=UPI0018CE6D8C|nr:scoloptoxin SSD43-like [Teleopsis dalmanni]
MHWSIAVGISLLLALQFSYIYTLNDLEIDSFCPNNDNVCLNNDKPSYFCKKKWDEPNARCSNFQFIHLSASNKEKFLSGHNGIRNKIAVDFNIANMNNVYWSQKLEQMAAYYVHECLMQKDECKLRSEFFRLNQNFIFRKRSLADHWPVRAVRHWYLEIETDLGSWEEFLNERKNRNMENFTQMIWPPLEYIGCSAAKMFDGYFILCNYYPPHDVENYKSVVEFGEPCSICTNRTGCSQIFGGLCGIDITIEKSYNPKPHFYLILSNILTIYFFQILK